MTIPPLSPDQPEPAEINIQRGSENVSSPLVIHPDVLTEAFIKSGLDKQESNEEKKARLQIEASENELVQFKEKWSFIVTTGMQFVGFVALLGVLVTSIYVAIDRNSSESAKDFSQKTITGIVGAITGFSIGKASNR